MNPLRRFSIAEFAIVVAATLGLSTLPSVVSAARDVFTVKMYLSQDTLNQLSNDQILKYLGGKSHWSETRPFSFLERDSAVRFDWELSGPAKWVADGSPLGEVCVGKCDSSRKLKIAAQSKDDFQVHLEGDFAFNTGTYNFGTEFSNGSVVLFIGSTRVIDAINHSGQSDYVSQPFYVDQGMHHVRLIYHHKYGPAYFRFFYQQ